MNEQNTLGINFLTTVLVRQECKKHGAEKYMPCWTIRQSNGQIGRAVCNNRARAAGFHAKIHNNSLRIK